MDKFIILVAIAAAVLNIILFFKVWRATNDIKDIKEKYIGTKEKYIGTGDFTFSGQLLKLYLGGNNEGALTFLNKCVIDKLIEKKNIVADKVGYSEEGQLIYEASPDVLVKVEEKKITKEEYFAILQKEVLENCEPLYKSIHQEIPDKIKNLKYSYMLSLDEINE